MDLEKYHAELEREFQSARRDCLGFIKEYNKKLPTDYCPSCGDEGHIPGLRCPACGFRTGADQVWLIMRDGEWGFEAIQLTDRRKVVREFRVKSAG